MNRNEKFVVTLNREFGSGGHAIGEELARRLGVKLIDKQILKEVSRKFNITPQEAERIEEQRPSWLDDFTRFYQGFMSMNEYAVEARDITSRQLFTAQAAAMKNIVARESCVVIGRCGFDVFKEHSNSLKLFVHAPLAVRIKRIIEKYGVDEKKANELIQDNDYTRQLYTRTFTHKEWYDVRNYDLTLDVSDFGIQGAVDFLMGLTGE